MPWVYDLRHFSFCFFEAKTTILEIFLAIVKTFVNSGPTGKILTKGGNFMNYQTLKSIDLFAGIGGIRLGFEQAFGSEIETVFVSEIDAKAQETYEANFGTDVSIAGDITQIPAESVPEFDICLAGFPCQAFSVAGKRLGFEDTRGTLFHDVARICKEHKPKAIFCENVKGLLKHDKGKTYQVIKNTFEELGYTVYEKVLNSRNFGVPQQRERIYIVAFRNDIDSSKFEFPMPTDSSKRLRDIIEENPVDGKYYLSEQYLDCLKEHRRRHEAQGHGFGYEILNWDGISNTLVCGGSGREKNLIIDDRQKDFSNIKNKGKINDKGLRVLTPREMARLQGFSDDFILPVADTHLYKHMGNSVSVPVIRAIAEKIKEVLD